MHQNIKKLVLLKLKSRKGASSVVFVFICLCVCLGDMSLSIMPQPFRTGMFYANIFLSLYLTSTKEAQFE